MSRKNKLLLFLVAMLFSAFGAAAQETSQESSKGPVEIEADTLTYDRQTDSYSAAGNVIIKFSGMTLTADFASFQPAANNAVAEGHVVMKTQLDTIRGDKINVNTVTKEGVVYRGSMFIAKNHFYLKGDRIEKEGEATYRIEEATATTCDGPSPDWRLKARRIDVTIDGYGLLRSGSFLVKDCPILYLPYLPFPAKTTRQTGFLFPYLSYSTDKHGLDIEIPFFWAISKDMDATFYQRYLEKNGFKEGIEFRYAQSADSYGTVYADFLMDRKHITVPIEGPVNGLPRDWQSDHKRWSYYWNHETRFDPAFYIRADVAKVSDHWYFKDFSQHNYYLDHYTGTSERRFDNVYFLGNESLASLSSMARVYKSWDIYSVTLFGRYTDDFTKLSNDTTLQTYPALSFKSMKQPVWGTPLLWDIESSYHHYYRTEGQRGQLYEVQPVFTLPFQIGRYFQLTPEVAYRGTFWQREDREASDRGRLEDRNIWKAGASINTLANKIYDFGFLSISKIKHTVKPELFYQYISSDTSGNNTDFVTRILKQNAVGYALTNTLTAKYLDKAGNVGYREFARLKLSQAYDISEARREETPPSDERRPFSVMNIEFDLNPTPRLAFTVRNTLDVYSGNCTYANYDLAVNDARGDAVVIGYHYAKNAVEELDLNLKGVLTKTLDAQFIARQNLLDKRTLENTYIINYHRQCWGIQLGYSKTTDDRRFLLLISLTGLGRFGG